MRVWLVAVVVVALSVTAGPFAQAARASITTPYAPSGGAVVAPGVRHEWGTLVTHVRQYVNVLEVDTAQPGLGVRLSQADGIATHRSTVIDQALAYDADERDVVASINGSTYAYMTSPDGTQKGAAGQGLNISDGELINAGAPASAAQILAFGIDSAGTPMIGNPQLDMDLTLPAGEVVAVNRVNQKRLATDAVVFTPRFDSHTWTDNLGDEYVVEGFDLPLAAHGTYSGTVVEVRAGQGDASIAPGQVVISAADGSAAAEPLASLAAGDPVTLTLSLEPAWQDVRNSVGGRNRLVADGANVAVESRRAPRIAVGIRADGTLLMISADGGSLDSGGVTLLDAADLMLSLGAVNAVNLDGGNSSQMAVRRPGDEDLSYVNAHLAEPEEYMRVVNALQIVSDAPTGDNAAPIVGEPHVALAAVDSVAKRNVELDVSWNVADASALDSIEVERRVGTGSWTSVLSGSPSATLVTIRVPFGRAFRVRVRATDEWGNTSSWAATGRLMVNVINESDPAVTRSGGWRRRAESRAFGGAYRRSKTSSAAARLTYLGYQVALIGQRGPRHGRADVSLDGTPVASVETAAPATEVRRMLYVAPRASTSASTTIELRNAGSAELPLVELDAFLVLRPVD